MWTHKNNSTHVTRANRSKRKGGVSSSASFLSPRFTACRERLFCRLIAPRQLSIGGVLVIEGLQKSLELSLRFLDARRLSREPDFSRPISPRTQNLRVSARLSVNLLTLNQKPLLELACGLGNTSFQ